MVAGASEPLLTLLLDHTLLHAAWIIRRRVNKGPRAVSGVTGVQQRAGCVFLNFSESFC
jgi:uncharacterized MAPEG superfamily protein